jgi:hypothetical protein
MIKNARPTSLKGILVPSNGDRLVHLVHLVAHAQISSKRHDHRIFSLRDVLDFQNLINPRGGADVSVAWQYFASHGAGEVIDAFTALSGNLFGATSGLRVTGKSVHWSKRALRQFGSPDRQRLRTHMASIGSYVAAFFQEPERRKKYLKAVQDPAELRRVAEIHLRKDRFIR